MKGWGVILVGTCLGDGGVVPVGNKEAVIPNYSSSSFYLLCFLQSYQYTHQYCSQEFYPWAFNRMRKNENTRLR